MQYERDRTKLIQAVLLMSTFSSDTEDKTGPWHWIGVAIGLCQTAGLHRSPHPTAGHIPQRRQRLWRLIWWSCVHQDAWFAVGMGRPMRVNLDDCDTKLPVPADIDAMTAGVSAPLREKYMPRGMADLPHLYVELIRLAIIQTNTLSTHYRARQVRPSITDVIEVEQRLSATHERASGFMDSEDHIVYYHACHLSLYIQLGSRLSRIIPSLTFISGQPRLFCTDRISSTCPGRAHLDPPRNGARRWVEKPRPLLRASTRSLRP